MLLLNIELIYRTQVRISFRFHVEKREIYIEIKHVLKDTKRESKFY